MVACQILPAEARRESRLLANAEELAAVSVYPEPRLYGKQLKHGDVLEVPLAPYETIVLVLKPGPAVGDVPPAAATVGKHLDVQRCERKVERVAFSDSGPALGPDWTCRLGDVRSAVRVALDAKLQVKAP